MSFWGAALAHIGVGVTLLGLAGVGFGAETIATLHKGVPARVGPYAITLDSVGERVGPNYKETVDGDDGALGRNASSPRSSRRAANSPPAQMTTTQAGLATLDFGQVYVSIADPTPDGAVPARLYWKPLVTLIWLGGCRDGARRRAVARRPAAALRRRARARRPAALAGAAGGMSRCASSLRAVLVALCACARLRRRSRSSRTK